MLAYAYALGVLKADSSYEEGICFNLIRFLRDSRSYYTAKFFFSEGDMHFPELWNVRTIRSAGKLSPWFNDNEERIEALEKILKSER